MSKQLIGFGLAIAFVAISGLTIKADDRNNNDRNRFAARLTGFQETPTLSTTGRGTFTARLNRAETMIHFMLSFERLETAVVVAHIHLGRPAIAGGVSVFLCGGGGRPPCTTDPTGLSGTVEGDIAATDVIGPTAQGISAAEFEELVRALRAGATYANVHTTGRPAGEVRGQIKLQNDDNDNRGRN